MKMRTRRKHWLGWEQNLVRQIAFAAAAATVEALAAKGRPEESPLHDRKRGLVRGLISALDHIEVDPQYLSDDMAVRPEMTLSPCSATLAVLHRKLVEILELLDVRPMDRSVEYVDYRLHEPIRVRTSDSNPASEGLVASVLRTGYMDGERVLRPMLVDVVKYVPSHETEFNEKEEMDYAEDKEES